MQPVGFEIETLQVLQFARTHPREGKHCELGAARFCSCAEDQVDLFQGRSAANVGHGQGATQPAESHRDASEPRELQLVLDPEFL